MKVTTLVPESSGQAEISDLISEIETKKQLRPFSQVSVDFFSTVSSELLRLKKYPELVALGYWLRKSNLLSMKKSFESGLQEYQVAVPRGIAFHVAPSNVDSIFLYSWALSVLVGNRNIVRVSSEFNPQINKLLEMLNEVYSDEQWNAITDGNLIITYNRDNAINSFISSHSDVRVIWGGDSTVNNFRSLAAKPTTKDITMSDKFSYTVINSQNFMDADHNKQKEIVKAFYNDAYWFDQLACSSPRIIYFVGDGHSCSEASEDFRTGLKALLEEQNHEDSISVSMEKLVFSYQLMAQEKGVKIISKKSPDVINTDSRNILLSREHCGGGLFLESFIANLDELIPLIDGKDQTLTYFGFSKEELKKLIIKINGKGINRVVPISNALNFSPFWDGYNLFYELTKIHIIT